MQEHTQGKTPLDSDTALQHSLDLGLLYLRDRRLAEADDFFQKIAAQKGLVSVSKVGSAMVLAFRDEADRSNKKFQETLSDKTTKNQPLRNRWRNYPPWREMIALALHHNKVNAPASFPEDLEAWLNPPRPTQRSNP